MGLIICQKDIKPLNITKNDRKIIYCSLKDLSYDDLKETLYNACSEIIKILSLDNKNLISYIYECSNKISKHIYEILKIQNLDNVFISFREEEETQILEYIDKDKLSNKSFRNITERIRNASSFKDKINLINMNIKSLIDLNDMLDAECLFDDEYNEFFKSLSKMNVVLLSKYIDEYGIKKDWHNKFNDFINTLSEEDKMYITNLKEKILLN